MTKLYFVSLRPEEKPAIYYAHETDLGFLYGSEGEAKIDCDLLKGFSFVILTSKGELGYVCGNFRIERLSEGKFVISFEAQPWAEAKVITV